MSQSRDVLAALRGSEYFCIAHFQGSEAKRAAGALGLELFESIIEPPWVLGTCSAITLI